MSMTPSAAVAAYAQAAKLATKAPGAAPAPGEPGAFSDLMAKAVGSVAETGRAAEMQTARLAEGKADIVDLVTAVAETELAMETLVSVRDRVISAYQDIMNMPI